MTPIKNDPQTDKQFWIACRASMSCTGRQAQLKMKFRLPTGGISIRYKCLSCNKPFHITV
jgi:hypothetical protein